MINLEEFYANENQLTTLPSEIGKMKKLRKLCIGDNFLIYIPEEIKTLPKLNELYGVYSNYFLQ